MLPHDPLSASSDGFGVLWQWGGWHILTAAQKSRELGTLLRGVLSSLGTLTGCAGHVLCSRGCSELGRKLSLISAVVAYGESWLSDENSLKNGDFFLPKKDPQTQWLTLNFVAFQDVLGESQGVFCSCSNISPSPPVPGAGAKVGREHPDSLVALKPAPVRGWEVAFGSF